MNILIKIKEQELSLFDNDGDIIRQYPIASAKNGTGQLVGSECTPLGKHIIRAKIGENCAENTIFSGRRPTGEIYCESYNVEFPDRDWILTRIMWLSGTEVGKNRLGDVDTMRRYIYIHGCPDNDEMGVPSSHGCIKMRNDDIIELFELVKPGTEVLIES
ncbi:MAG: L,D-transpeptidase [Gammaproteobacteria bacterium]|nr:L,D-transpeptidase [Gammaproteobacteria bacterium]